MAGRDKYVMVPCLFLDLHRKNEPYIGVLVAFWVFDGLNYVVKTALILGALVANR